MKTIYFDCFSGISGDMTLGALVDLGVSEELIIKAIKSLPIDKYEISWNKIVKKGIGATFADVKCLEDHHHRGLPKIKEIISAGDLTPGAKELAIRIFTRLAEAEAHVHKIDIEKVHFHEVGAVDAIVDIVGAAVAIDSLGDVKFIGSPVRTGFGTVKIAHGQFPIPAPATALLLRDVPVFAGEHEGEWVTPTGAAILSTVCSEFGQMPAMKIKSIGYGAGSREHAHLPNVLRVLEGETVGAEQGGVTVVEAQVDDMSPEIFSHLNDLLSQSSALDFYLTPIQMKKNRPGNLITVICRQESLGEISEIIFNETSSIGIRYYQAQRMELERELVTISSKNGEVRVKLARRGGKIVNAAPEYEDCVALARKTGIPLKKVQQEVMRLFAEKYSDF